MIKFVAAGMVSDALRKRERKSGSDLESNRILEEDRGCTNPSPEKALSTSKVILSLLKPTPIEKRPRKRKPTMKTILGLVISATRPP